MNAMPSNVDPRHPPAGLPRRLALQAGLAASGLLLLGGLVEYLRRPPVPAVATTFELDLPGAYAVGSATHVAAAGAWLLRDGCGLYAISTRCPHLGCTVERLADGYRCPCHGSRFRLDGQVINGPAARPLTYLTLTVSGKGQVQLHTDQPAPPAQRLVS